ncbi:1-acyl-sn-glycerol-3-phosphate acyltransferase [Sunxiuqinia sp. sy24]|uniref:1-acyl-sn-glycerol-3-phosphate acyltransferase n=1 Tax=Sunxiuqinia sp. sy24 TaxID=3461495 RepID=UPI004045D329
MIKSKHHSLTIWFFDLYFRWKMLSHFRGLEVLASKQPDPGRPVLLLQNHFSWWDGYWSFWLSKRFFQKRFHVMMLEEQLRKRMFINRCGAFSVRRNSRELMESLTYAAGVLHDHRNLVCLYPQGQIQPQQIKTIAFEKGASWILKNAGDPVQVWFCVTLTDYFSSPKPLIRFYLKHYEGERTTQRMELAYNHFRDECINEQHE